MPLIKGNLLRPTVIDIGVRIRLREEDHTAGRVPDIKIRLTNLFKKNIEASGPNRLLKQPIPSVDYSV